MKKLYTLIFIAGMSLGASAQLVYKDVAGVFYSRCTGCHHVKGGAPFPMMNYSQTSPWASSIQTDLNSGKMPPWSPDTTYSRFVHERLITASEKSKILSWISTGAQMGDTTIANGCPSAPVYNGAYKLKGKPDLILKVPAFPSNAAGGDKYNCFSIPTGLTQDRMIRAFEVVPSNPDIVHHVVIKVDTNGTDPSNTSGSCTSQPGDFTLDVWAPGGMPTVFPGQAPLKCGIRLKAGSLVNLQVHYPAGTGGMIDSTEMRIYFYPPNEPGVRNVYVTTPLQNWIMFIGANLSPTYTAQQSIPAAISGFGMFPHGHFITKSMTDYADNGTTTIPLIKINNWDFAWQGFYTFKNLVKIPGGYTLRASHKFDNTTGNPNNPSNPPVNVTAGEATTDEMLFDSFQYLMYQTGDENINLENLLATDTLLITTPVAENKPKVALAQSFVFPNPFGESTNLWTEGFDFGARNPELRIFDILGNEVHSRSLNEEHETLRLKLPAGVYFYTIHSGKTETSGKMVVMPQ